MSQIAGAPWTLQGEGYMFFYKFTKEWVVKNGFLPEELGGKFYGFFGNMMLVNYQSSPVGPYRELLFMPGKFKIDNQKWYSRSEERRVGKEC